MISLPWGLSVKCSLYEWEAASRCAARDRQAAAAVFRGERRGASWHAVGPVLSRGEVPLSRYAVRLIEFYSYKSLKVDYFHN